MGLRTLLYAGGLIMWASVLLLLNCKKLRKHDLPSQIDLLLFNQPFIRGPSLYLTYQSFEYSRQNGTDCILKTWSFVLEE